MGTRVLTGQGPAVKLGGTRASVCLPVPFRNVQSEHAPTAGHYAAKGPRARVEGPMLWPQGKAKWEEGRDKRMGQPGARP